MNEPRPKPPSLLQNLGAFFGHVRAAVRADVGGPRVLVRKTAVQDHPVPGTMPPITVRRTVTDEVIATPPPSSP